MRNHNKNAALNPQFLIWPSGNGPFVSSGETAGLWKLERTSASDVVSVSRKLANRSSRYDLWLQGAPTLALNISALDPATTLRVRQFLEGYNLFGQNFITLSVMASGPLGSKFYIGAGDNYAPMEMLGDEYDVGTYTQSGTTITFSRATHRQQVGDEVKLDFTSGTAVDGTFVVQTRPDANTFTVTAVDSQTTSGNARIVVPRIVTQTVQVPFDDPQYEYLRVTPFEAHAGETLPGEHRLHYVNTSISSTPENWDKQFCPRTIYEEWDLIKRYLVPITHGRPFIAVSPTQLKGFFDFPGDGMRTTPTLLMKAGSNNVSAQRATDGSLAVSTTATWALSADKPAPNRYGCAVTIGGMTGLTTGSWYTVLMDEPSGYLYAGYAP